VIAPDEHNGDLANPALDLLLDPDEASTPSTAAIDWLLARGVTVETFARYWAVGAARVIEVGGLTDLAYMPCATADRPRREPPFSVRSPRAALAHVVGDATERLIAVGMLSQSPSS
jgi:hypothetical protein